MFEHLDVEARGVLDRAAREARTLVDSSVGTEHVLLALTHTAGVTDLLATYGAGPDRIRTGIVSLGAGRDHRDREPEVLLAALGIDLGEVRRRVESAFGPDTATRPVSRMRRRRPGARWWPGCEAPRGRSRSLLGQRCLGMAPRLKRALERATRRAAPAGATPTHLLLGLLDGDEDNGARRILDRCGVDRDALAAAARTAIP